MTDEEQPKPKPVQRPKRTKRVCSFCGEGSHPRDWKMNAEHCPKCEVRMVGE